MKRLLFLSILFSLICFVSTAFGQKLRVVNLDKDNDLLTSPSSVVLLPGDTLQFKAVNGAFNILIIDAVRYFQIDDANIEVIVDSANPSTQFSEKYVVRSDNDEIINYLVYCITTNSWPDAPPRIIITAQ